MNLCGDVFTLSPVNLLKRVDFPVFGNPTRMHCMSAFLIPSREDFPDFFCFSKLVFSFFRRSVRFFNIFSDDLCLGHSLTMISRHAIRSRSEDAL